ncbi:uncharacterized protein LOC128720508 [Anopheles nili]|uniref:uncharacterized protein LOC128720508 n=1 Tax=Anopheles nili TaxID=185578 RepID=UPI00237A9BFA|nr:uncharacterized protein LOC128720508 [Anopheles nili]
MSTITLPCKDATRFCRFCLSEINLLIVIGSDATDQKNNEQILRLVRSHLRLELQGEKDFPSAICEMCISLLREFDALYQNAHNYSYALKVLLEGTLLAVGESPDGAKTIEPTLIEIYEPSQVVASHAHNAMVEEELLVNSIDGQIVLDDVSFHETDEQAKQIDVYHVDGMLQHIVMESGTCIDVRAGTSYKTINSTMAVPKRPSLSPNESKKSPSNRLVRCNHCNNLFVEMKNYYGHTCKKPQREVLSNARSSMYLHDVQRFECSKCSATFRAILQFHKHQYEVHGIRNENFGLNCNICQKLFSQRQDYLLHMQVMHPNHSMSLVTINQ